MLKVSNILTLLLQNNAYNYTDYVTDIYRMLDYLRNDLVKKRPAITDILIG